VLVVLREHESTRELADAIQTLPRRAPSVVPDNSVLRTYGIGAQILKDLGVQRMRVLSAPKQMLGISGFDLQIDGYVDQDSP
jgi:3,4-dihydroxy 2-butanone 4-phosphate synthase/GTP cyclohydrolase II